jgi:hypothetical protein
VNVLARNILREKRHEHISVYKILCAETDLVTEIALHCGIVPKHLANILLEMPSDSKKVYDLAKQGKITSWKIEGQRYFSVLDCLNFRHAGRRQAASDKS